MQFDWLTSGIPALFIILTTGILLGRIKVSNISLDLSGVLFSALILGHFGFHLPSEFLNFGLVIFVFTVGMQAGPGFFDSFRKQGRQFLFFSTIVIALTAVVSFVIKEITGIEKALNVGIFAGALTSSPGLAAATDASNSPLVSIAYGISYPIGLIGVILAVNIIPKLFKIDFKKEEQKYFESLKDDHPDILGRTFEISNPNIDDKSIKEINLRAITNCTASRMLHNEKAFTPNGETKFYIGDYVRLVGSEEDLKKAEILFGKPVEKEIPLSTKYDIRWVVVTNKKIINKNYKSVDLAETFNAQVVKIRRSGIDLTPTPSTFFRFGDKLLIAGSIDGVEKASKIVGDNKKMLSETDILPIFLGILVGIVLGKIKIPFFGLFEFSLGNTGGALIAGLALSKIGKTGPILWTMSSSANQLLRKIGLILFLAVVGTMAGEHLVETMQNQGFMLIWISVVITFVPIIIGIFIGHFILKINFLTLLGLITGLMTSTPGLGAVQSKSDTNAGPVAYATVYPFALVLVIIFSQLLVLI
ncbi:MAG: transporter [Bacteroidales bacterium]|nr:transporter [Bacteroidales bacterium]